MRNLTIIITILFFVFACKKVEITNNNQNNTDPTPTPTLPTPCVFQTISEINKRTSHYKKFNIQSYDYYLNTNNIYNNLLIARSFIDINKNSTPDFISASTYWPGYRRGELIVVVDNKVQKIVDSFQVHARKLIVADFNGDGQDDGFSFDQGLDVSPWPGGKNNLILLNGSEIINKQFPEIGIFHGGCAEDVDNDGDIDIFPLANGKPQFILINDGKANFTKKDLFNGVNLSEYFHCEFYDLNKDGNLDLIIGGHEWKSSPTKNSQLGGIYENHILWGDGKGNYDFSKSKKLPVINNWGTITDLDFYDLDKDGIEEIIISRTGGSDGSTMNDSGTKTNNFYNFFKIQILKKSGEDYVQLSTIEYPQGWPNLEWLDWIDVYDVDGDCNLDIVPDDQELNFTKTTQYQPIADMKKFFGMYFKGDGKGNFTTAYKK